MKTTLYKLNSKAVSWWTIEVSGCEYTISWGQDHTNMVATDNSITHAAESHDRARFEAQSRINKQLNRCGYTIDIPIKLPDLPMLAQLWEDHIRLVTNGKRQAFDRVSIQPKLDGMRCLATRNGLTSRTGEPITSVPHIAMALECLPPEAKLDGELYIHRTDLQTILSICKRHLPHNLSRIVRYHVFDMVDSGPFIEREANLTSIIKETENFFLKQQQFFRKVPEKVRTTKFPDEFPIEVVPTLHTNIKSDTYQLQHLLKQEFKKWTNERYEGCIVRDSDSHYEPAHRSEFLLKYKEVMDHEFEIVDVVEAANRCGTFVCVTDEGKAFKCDPDWTVQAKRTLLKRTDYYIGRWLHVEFEKYSKERKPLKPKGKLTLEGPESNK
jgi:ATP-dependent DNA ligase